MISPTRMRRGVASLFAPATFLLLLCLPAGPASAACELKAGGSGTVRAVIDAATVQLEDGTRVRLVGALAPEPPAWWKGPQWPAAEKAKSTLEKLALNRKVELRFAEGEPRKDRHGRYLAQLFVGTGVDSVWVQGRLIEQGLALSYSLKSHKACAKSLQAAEAGARSTRSGFWKEGVFRVLSASEPTEVLKRLGTYQIVTGSIVSMGKTSRWTFLNFSNDWKSDFTAVIEASNRRNFPDGFLMLDKIEGKSVIVRGWVERWNGPAIKLTHPQQLEILER